MDKAKCAVGAAAFLGAGIGLSLAGVGVMWAAGLAAYSLTGSAGAGAFAFVASLYPCYKAVQWPYSTPKFEGSAAEKMLLSDIDNGTLPSRYYEEVFKPAILTQQNHLSQLVTLSPQLNGIAESFSAAHSPQATNTGDLRAKPNAPQSRR